MGLHKARVDTLKAILGTLPGIANTPHYLILSDEFNETYAVRKIRRTTRRRLLEILHSTRALDGTLKAFISHHGCKKKPKKGKLPGVPQNLGGYLYALRDHSVVGLGKLTESQRIHFQSQIVDTRNTFIHEAGTFPADDNDVAILLSEMHTCLTTVSRL